MAGHLAIVAEQRGGGLFDAIVIGAGPAGSQAAARLAAAGHKVAVVERDAAPGLHVCCTGIVSGRCLALLDLPDTLIHHRSSSASFIAPSGRRIRLQRPETVAYVVDRPAVDGLLAARSAAAGAHYLFNTRVTDVQVKAEHAVVTVDSAEGRSQLEARAVIVATGFGSRLPRALGMGKVSDCVVAAQTPVEAQGLFEVEVYIDQELAPGGFAWLAPTGPGRGWAGLIARRDHKVSLARFISRLKTAGRITAAGGEGCFGAVPIQPIERSVAHRILVVGEAAGQIKPTTGGGIYYGLLCADVAADVLGQALSRGDLSAAALMPYEHKWRALLNPEVSVGYAAHSLWGRFTNADAERLMRLARRSGLSHLVGRSQSFSFDWHAPLLMQLAELFPARQQPWGRAAQVLSGGDL